MSKKRIAIVEDSPYNRLLFQAMLEDRFDVVEFEDGETALAGRRGAAPDLVLMDISLPRMDGTEVLSKLREDETLRSVPVIALTAHAMRGDREKYLGLGFDDWFGHVVDEASLFEPIDRLLATAAG